MISGVDIVKIERFKNVKARFLDKYFSSMEIEYINSKGNNLETIAGMYAGKEALLKSLGVALDKYPLKEIEIGHLNGQPYISLSDAIKKEIDNYEFSISISHDGDYAIAFVVGLLKFE